MLEYLKDCKKNPDLQILMDLKDCARNLERQFLNTFDAKLGLTQTIGFIALFVYLFYKPRNSGHLKIIFFDQNVKLVCHIAALSAFISKIGAAGRRYIFY